MIKIDHLDVYGFEAAIRGMRNPMNSWDKSDSGECSVRGIDCMHCSERVGCDSLYDGKFKVGENDLELMRKLAGNGPVHAKYRRMIVVTCDILAPLYWWKEFDTYKVGTVANSCSTMHKIAAKEFTREDFSCEHLKPRMLDVLDVTIGNLNVCRNLFLEEDGKAHELEPISIDDMVQKPLEIRKRFLAAKEWWWQMIQLLPSSYNQKRTVQMNYEVIAHILPDRMGHKLDEWREFCQFMLDNLPHAELLGKNISMLEEGGARKP